MFEHHGAPLAATNSQDFLEAFGARALRIAGNGRTMACLAELLVQLGNTVFHLVHNGLETLCGLLDRCYATHLPMEARGSSVIAAGRAVSLSAAQTALAAGCLTAGGGD